MSIECQCDRCGKLFNSSEIYCGECVAELEGQLKYIENTCEEAAKRIKDLENELNTR